MFSSRLQLQTDTDGDEHSLMTVQARTTEIAIGLQTLSLAAPVLLLLTRWCWHGRVLPYWQRMVTLLRLSLHVRGHHQSLQSKCRLGSSYSHAHTRTSTHKSPNVCDTGSVHNKIPPVSCTATTRNVHGFSSSLAWRLHHDARVVVLLAQRKRFQLQRRFLVRAPGIVD